jgi:hypothetical protein
VKIGREKDRAMKQALVDQFGGKCQRCGYDRCLRALHFHHVDDSEKSEWNGGSGRASLEEVVAHPERFLLLCANCHFEEHDRIDQENRIHATCRSCGETFETEAYLEKEGKGIYCSKACQHKDRHKVAIAGVSDRLWKHVEKVGECWVWTGYAPDGVPVMGYPVSYKKNTIKPAARVLWELERGPLSAGQQVWRACPTPNCIRPDHQLVGTRRSMLSRAGRVKRITARNGKKPPETQGELLF